MKSKADELREKGYHVLEEYNIAFKAPGKLVFKLKLADPHNSKNKDTIINYSIYPYKNDSIQYIELSIRKNEPKMTEMEISKSWSLIEGNPAYSEKIKIKGKKAILYNHSVETKEIRIYTGYFIYTFFIRDSLNLKNKSNEIIKSITFLN